jgi:uncharacterized protein involved in outer membrane biogenesis
VIIIGSLSFVAVLAVFIYGVYTSLDSIVEAAIEKYGSEITGTTVTLDEVKISLIDGRGTIRGLSVGNPKGFAAGHSFQLGEIQLALDVGTITGNPVVVKKILIDKPVVTYELGSDGSNIAAIQRNVQAYMGPGDRSKGDTREGPKLVIENLYIKGGEVNVTTTVLKDRKLSTRLPDIHVKAIGKEKGGTSPGEVAKQIVAHLAKSVGSAVATLNLDQLGDAAEDATKRALEGASGAVKETSEKLKKLLN